MPNAFVQMSKFLWAVITFGGEISVDAFCRLFELHCQPRKVCVDSDTEPCEVQNGCCTFVPRKNNKKIGLERIEISLAPKNKWEGDWTKYWFYAKIGFPGPEGTDEEIYPLATEVAEFEHTYQPSFNKHLPEFKSCVGAFKAASRACGGRDLVEEFLLAKVWPITS